MVTILSTVPGEYVGRASQSLPAPETAAAEQLSATIDAGWVGPVRINYQRRRIRHGKSVRWAWIAVSAEAVDASPPIGD